MKLILGDCLESMRSLESNSIDSIVTDPPYGLSFMGKKWDYDVPSVEIWRECLRVLKPGGHVLSFCGTRTYHRMVVNMEDAGFEIRDQLQWIYGQGFPKSLDISKAIDKSAGVEREVIGVSPHFSPGRTKDNMSAGDKEPTAQRDRSITAPATDDAKKWSGWGTALKPAVEPVCVARKPLTEADSLTSLVRACQSLLFAGIVRRHSKSNLSEKTQQSIAQWLAEKSTLTPDALSEAMATLRFESENDSNLNTELSWLDTLGAISQHESTFTTETASSLTTDLKILKSLLSQSTQKSITQDETEKPGASIHASPVASLLSGVTTKLACILTPSALGLATEKADPSISRQVVNEPICLARKPLDGTVAGNVLKHGVGGLNIDGCRIGSEQVEKGRAGRSECESEAFGKKLYGTDSKEFISGRFPANVIFDEEAAAMLDEQTGDRPSGYRFNPSTQSGSKFQSNKGAGERGYADSGGASRFFYVAKASKRERNAGLDGMPKKQTFGLDKGDGLGRGISNSKHPNQNHHPTVKPVALMQYLVRLITPNGGVVLDPFMGSGSTGVACVKEGFGFIGCEMNEEYLEIAERRIEFEQVWPEAK